MVHMTDQLIDVFALNDGKYILSRIYALGDTIESSAVKRLSVNVTEVFPPSQ